MAKRTEIRRQEAAGGGREARRGQPDQEASFKLFAIFERKKGRDTNRERKGTGPERVRAGLRKKPSKSAWVNKR